MYEAVTVVAGIVFLGAVAVLWKVIEQTPADGLMFPGPRIEDPRGEPRE